MPPDYDAAYAAAAFDYYFAFADAAIAMPILFRLRDALMPQRRAARCDALMRDFHVIFIMIDITD